MMYKVKITPMALNEWQDSVYYYNQMRKGLGKSFNTEVKRILREIKTMPSVGFFMYEKVRYWVLKLILTSWYMKLSIIITLSLIVFLIPIKIHFDCRN